MLVLPYLSVLKQYNFTLIERNFKGRKDKISLVRYNILKRTVLLYNFEDTIIVKVFT